MKKKLLIVGIGVVSIVVFVLLKYIFSNQPCLPPEKPSSVPNAAVWKGGCDGGNWIELVSINRDRVRFKIYRDWNGDLILDADFEYKGCDSFILTESNWVTHIAYFGNALEIYETSHPGNRCRLVPIHPAYGGEAKNNL